MSTEPDEHRLKSLPPGLPGAVAGIPSPRTLLPLFVLFGSLYFVQGIVEPTAGLPAQPVRSQLYDWGQTAGQVGIFFWFIGIPWMLKPLFGLVSDFLPIGGLRRRPYLTLSTAATAIGFVSIALLWTGSNQLTLAAWLLFGVCVALAFTDVVVDALAVETGQPLGLTGQMQAVQWGAMSVASILGGTVAGYVATNQFLRPAMLGCCILAAGSLLVVLAVVKEPRQASDPAKNLRMAWRQMASGRRMAVLASVGAYLFLWNFNPFSSNVLQHYSTEVLHFSEQFYGNLNSLLAIAQVVACVAYFYFCRRIPFAWLVHGSIAAGILSTLCYLPMHDANTAVAASIAFGLTYQTATLIQLDLAARVCPTQAAGTIFALLMAISNAGINAADAVSGGWYDGLSAHWQGDRHAAFDALVWIGAGFTAGCWLLLPVMRWAGVGREEAGDR